MAVSELKEELSFRERTIGSLRSEVTSMNKGLSDMSKELDSKGKEILHILSEAHQALR